MFRNLPRALCWGLALALGVLVAAWRPIAAQGAAGPALIPPMGLAHAVSAPALLGSDAQGEHSDHCPSHLSAAGTGHRRGPSWHRGTGRRTQRAPHALLHSSSRAGSIPAADPLNLQRAAWHLVPRPPVHGTGQLAAPPRAPPR